MIPQDPEKQSNIAEILNKITVAKVGIESLEESISEWEIDLQAIYKDLGDKKTRSEIKIIVDAYVDAEKAIKENQTKIDKTSLIIQKIKDAEEELSVLSRFKTENVYDEADEIVGSLV